MSKPLNKEKRVLQVSCVGTACNVLLFFVKLYISISANSISIFSDAINNLADGLSCLLVILCMYFALKNKKKGLGYVNSKIEQTLSFILALVVLVVGFSFLYSSAERLMYPTPIWFTQLYFWIIVGTIVVKIGMSVFYHFQVKVTGSSTLKVMRMDSIMDAGVTLVTLISFAMTKITEYTVDAYAGILISVFIMVEAVGLCKTSLSGVLNYVKKDTRLELEETLSENFGKVKSIAYNKLEGRTLCYVEFEEEISDVAPIKEATEKYNIEVYVIR